MPYPLDSYIELMSTAYGNVFNQLSYCIFAMNDAADAILANNWSLAHAHLHTFATRFSSGINYLCSSVNGVKKYTYDSLYWINDSWPTEPEPPEIDMDSIINAMMTANFDQLQSFIGIEDAYRVALWNAPFNANFYAALARGFMKWP